MSEEMFKEKVREFNHDHGTLATISNSIKLKEVKMEESKTEETKDSNWLEQEVEENKSNAFDGEKLPALELKENVVVNITVDFSEPFDKWKDEENKTIKAIIPVEVKGEKLVWWLNVKNPMYGQIIQKGLQGENVFKVMQTGTQKNTRYNFVEEDTEENVSDGPSEVASIQA